MLTALTVFWYRVTRSKAGRWAETGGRIAWQILKPPRGHDVRRYIALTLLGFGIIRLLGLPAVSTGMTWVPSWAYGSASIILAILLLLTNNGRRRTLYGYAVTWLTLALCAMAVADSWPYINAMLVYFLPAWASFGEATSRDVKLI